MRAIWNGVVSFGLVSVPVRLYTATTSHDIKFHQVHFADGGRIRYKRVCEACGEEVAYADIVKGHETETGDLVTLDEDDMATLPTSTSREIEVVEFVPAEQVDPLLMGRSYYLEPDPRAIKPYALLREVLREADQMAVARVAIRQRQRLGLLRVRDRTIVLQTMLWPDEVREPDFEPLRADVQLRPQELQMASSLVGTMGTEFDPSKYEDEYTAAVEDLIEQKRQHGSTRPAPAAATGEEQPMTDLLAALQRSVEEATGRRAAAQADQVPEQRSSGRRRSASGTSAASSGTTSSEGSPKTGRKSTSAKTGRKPTTSTKPAASKQAAAAEPKRPARKRA